MRINRHIAAFLAVSLLASPALAEGMTVSGSIVKAGYFQAPDCTPEADPKMFNECMCEANIKKAQVTGLSPEVTTLVNDKLAMLPEKLAAESCEGKSVTPSTEGLKVNLANADYEVAYQTADLLTVLITYSTYGAGADHPLDGTEGFTFDLKNGHALDPIAALKPEEIVKADSFIKKELLKKYPTALYDEAKDRTDPYLTENGCDTCTIFYGKDGWKVRFQLAAIAPYMTGEPEITVPAEIIPSPEQLSLRN